MTPTEALQLCRLAAACCPQQKFDEFSPDAWGMLLDDVPFADGKDALQAVAKRQPFVSPAEIRAEARRTRAKRIEAAALTPPADLDADDTSAYIAWLGHARRAIADGHVPAPEVLPRRPVLRAIEGTLRAVDDA